ncbi:MAG TPA: polysaccharide biosynthesis/export family protein [Thermoanaerobaculia bacterium]|nr:polysaccharide biosynthesis/export family protein [Thermoanaerobaculia bacterium]
MQRTQTSVLALISVLALALVVGGGPALSADDASRTRPGESPVRGGASTTDFALGPEDVIEVFVWKEEELSRKVTVRPDGRVALPLAGELMASGKTPADLEKEIAERLREYIDVPLVTVIVEEINSPKVSVMGEVRRPGRFVISQQTTILDAIALSGGFTEFAHRRNVVVLRSTPSGVARIPIDVKYLVKNGGRPFYLKPGDTVHVN